MKVLVAIDSSTYSDEILDAVAHCVWPEEAEFLILTVVEPSPDWEVGQTHLHSCKIILEDRTNMLKTRLPKHSIRCETIHGSAKDLIVATASSIGADLIIVGSHGDTGVRRSRVGSVAAAVVNKAPCNVEVVKIYAQKPKQKKVKTSCARQQVPA